MISQYDGNAVRIYDLLGNLMLTSTIEAYDSKRMEISIAEPIKTEGSGVIKSCVKCKVLIVAEPTPIEFMGTAKIKGFPPHIIALYQGKKREVRQHKRYRINTEADIISLIKGNYAYPMCSSVKVKILNISKSGLRIRTESHALTVGDRFELSLRISKKTESFLVEVINNEDINSFNTDYGCSFLAGGTVMRRVLQWRHKY